jgi:hypothetical protein
VTKVVGMRSIAKAMELPPTPTVRTPALDPTDNSAGSFYLSSAPPKLKTLALLALGSHSRSWYQI